MGLYWGTGLFTPVVAHWKRCICIHVMKGILTVTIDVHACYNSVQHEAASCLGAPASSHRPAHRCPTCPARTSLCIHPPPLASPPYMLKPPLNLRSLPRPFTALGQVRQWPPDPPDRPPRPPKPPGIIGEPTAPEPWWWTFDYPPPTDGGDGGNGFSPPADIVGESLHRYTQLYLGTLAAGLCWLVFSHGDGPPRGRSCTPLPSCALNEGGNAGAAADPHTPRLHSGLDSVNGELTT